METTNKFSRFAVCPKSLEFFQVSELFPCCFPHSRSVEFKMNTFSSKVSPRMQFKKAQLFFVLVVKTVFKGELKASERRNQ